MTFGYGQTTVRYDAITALKYDGLIFTGDTVLAITKHDINLFADHKILATINKSRFPMVVWVDIERELRKRTGLTIE